MEQKNKIVPELRFPEFVKDGEWNQESISSTCEVLNNRRKPITGSERKKGIYSYYGASGIIDYVDNYIFDEKLLLIGEDGAKWGAYENTAFIVDGKYWVNNHAHVLKPIGITHKLLESYLVKLDIHSFITGAAPPKLTLGKLKEIPIPVPKNPKEQQKIADCLTSLDELITAHNDKLETLKNHKKGLLQNLFPQEGQTVPNYRFPEFMNDGDWEIKTVSEVAYYENGKAHEQHIIINGKYKVVNSKFISTDGEVVKYTNEALCLADINDTLMVLSDVPNGRAIAKCFYVDKNNTYTVNQRICKLKPLDINGKILYYLLNRNPYFLAFDDGVKQTNLKNDDVLNCEIVLPKKTKIQKEQQKIADCLLAVDNLITAQTEKIEQLKAHKKGLMQGLFPKIEE